MLLLMLLLLLELVEGHNIQTGSRGSWLSWTRVVVEAEFHLEGVILGVKEELLQQGELFGLAERLFAVHLVHCVSGSRLSVQVW